MKYFLPIIILFLLIPSVITATSPSGKLFNDSLKNTGTNAGYTGGENNPFDVSPSEYIGRVIKVLLSMVGVLLLLMLIYGGFIWMNARGNETEADKARKIIQNAIIGLVIVLAAYAITTFVTSLYFNANINSYDETELPEGA